MSYVSMHDSFMEMLEGLTIDTAEAFLIRNDQDELQSAAQGTIMLQLMEGIGICYKKSLLFLISMSHAMFSISCYVSNGCLLLLSCFMQCNMPLF